VPCRIFQSHLSLFLPPDFLHRHTLHSNLRRPLTSGAHTWVVCRFTVSKCICDRRLKFEIEGGGRGSVDSGVHAFWWQETRPSLDERCSKACSCYKAINAFKSCVNVCLQHESDIPAAHASLNRPSQAHPRTKDRHPSSPIHPHPHPHNVNAHFTPAIVTSFESSKHVLWGVHPQRPLSISVHQHRLRLSASTVALIIRPPDV